MEMIDVLIYEHNREDDNSMTVIDMPGGSGYSVKYCPGHTKIHVNLLMVLLLPKGNITKYISHGNYLRWT